VLGLNKEAPAFSLEGVAGSDRRRFTLAEFAGRWVVLFFYPADFTFVCPTELRGFQARLGEFTQRNAAVVGISADGVDSHHAWAEELGGITFPLLSDATRETSRNYGVLDEEDGRPFRATFLVTPKGLVAHATASPANVGRSVEETLRVLSALQTGRLCPADWRPGQPTLDAEVRR
jgi:alkyl hydroperoxide reductase subunit AhpC